MEIIFRLVPTIVLKWWVYLEEDEKKYEKEIKQEMDLNMKEQYNSPYKLY